MLLVKQLREALKGLPDDTLVYLTDEYDDDYCTTLKFIEICEDGIYLVADNDDEEDEEYEEDEEADCDCEKCSFERINP